MERQWYVTEDRQGGEFGFGRLYTANQWLDQACKWLESDGAFDDDWTEEDYRAQWETVIDENPQDFIDYVDDMWEITLVEHGVDGNDYYAEFTLYAAYFNGDCIGDADTLEEAIALVQQEIDKMIATGDVDSVQFDRCFVERFIENDFDAYDDDPLAYIAAEDPQYKEYL